MSQALFIATVYLYFIVFHIPLMRLFQSQVQATVSFDAGLKDEIMAISVCCESTFQLMHTTDAYVSSSSWKGMPTVLLEASASGLPIVATDVGGNREVVVDGVTGFLVPPRNPEALAEAMLRMMNLPEEKRREMGRAARKHVEENFSLDHVVDLWEALYKELLERKGKKQ